MRQRDHARGNEKLKVSIRGVAEYNQGWMIVTVLTRDLLDLERRNRCKSYNTTEHTRGRLG